MKILLVTLAVLFGLLVLAAAGVAIVLDPMVKRVATEQTSKALGVPVEIADADASLYGRVALDGFVAGNPEGFGEPRSIRFDHVAAKARLGSLFDDVVEIDQVIVRRPELTIEFKGHRSNFAALMERLAERAPEERADTEGRAFRIRHLKVEGATLRFRADTLGDGTRELTLPTIELANLGTAEDAATMSEILAALLQTLSAEALKAARDILPEDLLNALAGDLEAAAKRFGGRLQDAAEKARRSVEEKLRERVEDEVEKRLDKLREKLPRQ